MSSNSFFLKNFFSISKLFPKIKFNKNIKINDIKSLGKANKNDLTFFDSKKYKKLANQTQSLFCITTRNLINELPKKTEKIIVNNVLTELARVTKLIYPFSDIDYPDLSLKDISKHKYKFVKYGNNVLVGKKC